MGAFRVPYAFAWGKYGNFYNRTDNLIASLDATPDISGGSLFWTNNASATTITYFDGKSNGLINPEEGQEITVGVIDGNTTFGNSAQLRLSQGANVTATAGSFWSFLYHNSSWYQTAPASLNTAGAINGPAQGFLQARSGDLGTTGLLTITPFTSVIGNVAGTSSSMTIRGMPGGYDGQRVTFINQGSSVTFITNSAGATDSFVVSTVAGVSAIVTGSVSVTFVRGIQGTTSKWFEAGQIA